MLSTIMFAVLFLIGVIAAIWLLQIWEEKKYQEKMTRLKKQAKKNRPNSNS